MTSLDVLGNEECFAGIDMLRIDVQSAPSMVKLHCSGRIVLGVEAETLRCMAISRPERRIVLDLQQIDAIDAAGLGLLVELHCRARQRAGTLAVANPSPCVRRLMTLTRLELVLQVTASADAAIINGDDSEIRQCAMTA